MYTSQSNAAFASGWRTLAREHYRETADPSVLFHDGKWYLYPSCGMAYVTSDFVTWEHHRVEPYNPGYAPTIEKHGNRFLLTACGAPMYAADNPLGPFTEVGKMLLPSGEEIGATYLDPMVFADDDGRLFLYWGISSPGIWAAELDPKQPNQLISDPQIVITYNSDHEWERFGDFNEHPGVNFNEGPWMLKVGNTYYLTYAAPGTQFHSYGMGCYTAASPLGPFCYQGRNPILHDTHGMVTGPGHGCVVRGPENTLWAFYTCLVGQRHVFERRVGMDPAGIDAEGNLFVLGASETPQQAPGVSAEPHLGNGTGEVLLSASMNVTASSELPAREATRVNDNNIRTWWEHDPADNTPFVEIFFPRPVTVSSIRLQWRESGLDFNSGALPGPFQYLVEGFSAEGDGVVIADKRDNGKDMMIEFLTFDKVKVKSVRLTITGSPRGIIPSVTDFSIFGWGE
jgi:hypothetical protein